MNELRFRVLNIWACRYVASFLSSSQFSILIFPQIDNISIFTGTNISFIWLLFANFLPHKRVSIWHTAYNTSSQIDIHTRHTRTHTDIHWSRIIQYHRAKLNMITQYHVFVTICPLFLFLYFNDNISNGILFRCHIKKIQFNEQKRGR